MANMRDKLISLKGKKIALASCGDFYHIRKADRDYKWYGKIVDIGDDYFEVEIVVYDETSRKEKTTYAISRIATINGDVASYDSY